MADISSLNRVRYAGLDFDTIEDELRSRLQVKFASSFNDFSVSSLGIVLLDFVSFGLDTLSFYLDRRATDMYLATARTRRSVSLLARQLGYKMHGAVAASVDLSVGAKQLYSFPLPIPKGFQLQTAAGIIYEAAQSVTIPANTLVTQTVPCYQGQTITESFVSDGTANQVFKLTRVPQDYSIVQGTVQTACNGTPFTESDFITFDATDQFEINYNDEPPSLRFGDGVAGNIPVKSGSVVVTYVASLGAAGQVLSGTINKEVTPLVVQFTQTNLIINNPQASVGGSDPEELEHAKVFAPKVFKSRRVAVTRGDYEALAGSYVDPLFGRVAVAQAISARSADKDLELQNLLDDISNQLTLASNTITSALSTPTTGAFARWTVLNTSVSVLQTNLATLLTKVTILNNNLGNALTNSRTIKSQTGEIQNDYTDAHTEVIVAKANINTLKTTVAGLPTDVVSQLTSADQTAYAAQFDSFLTSFNKVDALLSLMNALAASSGSAADATSSLMQGSQTILAVDIGLSTGTAGSVANSMNTQLVNALAALGVSTIPYSGQYAQLKIIESAVDLNKTSIDADAALIEDHVDSILAADCQANLVVVPILARDAAGFYAAPSSGLIRSLQSYLDSIKEVTQSVKVTSGAGFLVPAVIKVRLAIKVGISEQVAQASARSIVDGILRDRAFGNSLYVSDIVEPLSLLTGVVFVNVTIQGYRPTGQGINVDKVDSDGNLIISNSEVITLSLDDLAVTTEVVTTT